MGELPFQILLKLAGRLVAPARVRLKAAADNRLDRGRGRLVPLADRGRCFLSLGNHAGKDFPQGTPRFLSPTRRKEPWIRSLQAGDRSQEIGVGRHADLRFLTLNL